MTDDRFAIPDALIPLDQALASLEARLRPVVPVETVPIMEAGQRILAEDLVSPVTSPPFPAAAMDGFAFRAADLPAPDGLRVTARIAAGRVHQGGFGPGEAARIFTGAPMPAGLDTVAMQEDCRVETTADGEVVHLPGGLASGTWVRQAGEDFAAGTTVLAHGKRLRPQDVAMAAAIGKAELKVYRRLRVGVFSTGDEVVEPGWPLPPGAIWGCNRQGVAALASGLGCIVDDLGNIPDRLDETTARLAEAALRCDLLITTGGVSVGGEDHVRDAVEALGAIHMWRLAVKPGKPTALGHIGDAAFVGLPGYPVSALVTFMLIARPVILRLAGATAEPMHPLRLPVRAAFSFDKNHRRRQFLRVSLHTGADGRPEAALYRSQEPNVLSSLVNTDGLVDVREDTTAIRPGDLVEFMPYPVLQW